MSGETSSLDRLAELLAGRNVELERDGDHGYLHGAVLDGAADTQEVSGRARRVLPRVYAALRLEDVMYPPIALTDRISGGSGPATVFAEVQMVAPARLTVGGDPGPTASTALFARVRSDSNYAAAMELFARPPP